MRHMARASGQINALELDSAGTANWHAGKPPYGPMQEAARARGYDLSDLRAHQAIAEDFQRFDLILAMDAENLSNLEAIRPQDASAQLVLFTDLCASERRRSRAGPVLYTGFRRHAGSDRALRQRPSGNALTV